MNDVKIILCDDNKADLDNLRKSAEEYIKQREFCGEVVGFSSSEELLRDFEENNKNAVSIYVLDVIMPKLDGIDLGRRIRERDKKSAVIYISSSREYSLDAYSVRAFSYLIKPYSQEKFFSELDECMSQMDCEPQKFSIKTADGILLISLSEIIAVEYFNHRLIFHLTEGRKVESAYRRQPFDVQAEKLLQTESFIKISASYLINICNVQGIKSDEFIMCNGSQYKITRKYASARQQYIKSEMLIHKNVK